MCMYVLPSINGIYRKRHASVQASPIYICILITIYICIHIYAYITFNKWNLWEKARIGASISYIHMYTYNNIHMYTYICMYYLQ